jgi:hypothetical protein
MSDVVFISGGNAAVFDGQPAPQGAKGDPGSPGEGYATRTAMAARAAPALKDDVYLTEAGREGKFVVDAASAWTAAIAADTAQGVFVPSTADAAKVYVRADFLGGRPLNPKWFGAKLDDVNGSGGTNDGAAFTAMFALVAAIAKAGNAAPRAISLPGEAYIGSTTIDLVTPIHWRGDGPGNINTTASVTGVRSGLRRSAGGHHVRCQRHNTTGDTGTVTSGTNGVGSDGSIIEGICFRGGFAGTEGEFHAISSRASITVRDCIGVNLQGDVVNLSGSTDGSPALGLCNQWLVSNVWGESCRNTLKLAGIDANAGASYGVRGSNNRQAVIVDDSAVGNNAHIDASTANPCGLSSYNDGISIPVTSTWLNGHRYNVVRGQETGASTNPPTGAATDNTWWLYSGIDDPAAIPAAGIPAWFSGILCRFGGSYFNFTAGTNNSQFIGCYVEGGTPVAQLFSPAMVIGGYLAFSLGSNSTCGLLHTHLGAIETKALTVDSGAATPPALLINSTNTASLNPTVSITASKASGNGAVAAITRPNTTTQALFSFNSGGTPDGFVGTAIGVASRIYFLGGAGNGGAAAIDDTAGLMIGNGIFSSAAATISPAGVATVASVKVGANQVVGARQTGWAADTGTAKKTANATYSGTAEAAYTQATIQALMNAVRDLSQTQKSIKDALIAHGIIGA